MSHVARWERVIQVGDVSVSLVGWVGSGEGGAVRKGRCMGAKGYKLGGMEINGIFLHFELALETE